MTLGRRVVLLVVLIHLPLAVLAYLVARNTRSGWVVAELAVLLSLALSARLLRLGRAPRELARSGRELLAEGDFTTRFRRLGQRDVDELVELFNALSEELRRERLRLEERDLLLGKLVAASPAGVVMLDLDGRVELVNPAAARLLGESPESAAGLLGRPAGALPEPVGSAASALSAGEVLVLALAGGRRARLSRAEFQDRGFGRTFLLLEEITVELRASERAAYEKVIRLVSHEVNNSAGAIGSLLESSRQILAGAGFDPAGAEAMVDVDEALSVSARRVRHLAAFVDGFAEVVRLPEPIRQALDAAALTRDLLTLHQADFEHRRLEVELVALPGLPSVLGDRGQLEQAMVNLFRNALEATPDGGRIALDLRYEDGYVVFSLRDSGPGIPPAAAAQLFTPFFSTKRDGRGIGLTLVREIASRHGGEVGLENHPDGGAVAVLRLPAAS